MSIALTEMLTHAGSASSASSAASVAMTASATGPVGFSATASLTRSKRPLEWERSAAPAARLGTWAVRGCFPKTVDCPHSP